MEKIKKCDLDHPYYEEFPRGWIVASLIDFYDEQANLILDKAFLVKSNIHKTRYWANRVKDNFPYIYSDFPVFLEDCQVFVQDKNNQ